MTVYVVIRKLYTFHSTKVDRVSGFFLDEDKAHEVALRMQEEFDASDEKEYYEGGSSFTVDEITQDVNDSDDDTD